VYSMPSIVGPIKINSVGGGVVNFGDSFYLSPKSTSKTSAGSGSFNTGDFINTNTGVSSTNPIDPDVNDQNQTANT
jgi:spore germination protein PF